MTNPSESELERLRKENARLRSDLAATRARLHWLQEDSTAAIKRQTARAPTSDDLGRVYCPDCHACVWEPPNVPHYWRRCQYANKAPPEWCPWCGQHLTCVTIAPKEFEEDPTKNQHKGEQKKWHLALS